MFVVSWGAIAAFGGCSSSREPIDTETHFQCTADPDCSSLGSGALCVRQHCSVSSSDCIERYSPDLGFGFGTSSDRAVAPPGMDAGPVDPPEVLVAHACSSALGPDAPADPGACDVSRFMSVDAALCIARQSGLTEGQSGLRGSLVYNFRFHRVIYSVENVLHEMPGKASGDSLTIDAITGSVLERSSWGSIS
jgi:hypothetical protein